jgi:hypothetical protein
MSDQTTRRPPLSISLDELIADPTRADELLRSDRAGAASVRRALMRAENRAESRTLRASPQRASAALYSRPYISRFPWAALYAASKSELLSRGNFPAQARTQSCSHASPPKPTWIMSNNSRG